MVGLPAESDSYASFADGFRDGPFSITLGPGEPIPSGATQSDGMTGSRAGAVWPTDG